MDKFVKSRKFILALLGILLLTGNGIASKYGNGFLDVTTQGLVVVTVLAYIGVQGSIEKTKEKRTNSQWGIKE